MRKNNREFNIKLTDAECNFTASYSNFNLILIFDFCYNFKYY